jgi:hypothetical protein
MLSPPPTSSTDLTTSLSLVLSERSLEAVAIAGDSGDDDLAISGKAPLASTGVMAGVGAAVLIAIAAVILFLFFRRRRVKPDDAQVEAEHHLTQDGDDASPTGENMDFCTYENALDCPAGSRRPTVLL